MRILWSRVWDQQLSRLSAVFGILLIVGGDSLPLVVVGFVLMGVGYAAVLPLAFSRAAADREVPAGKGIASVATFAYGAMTLGPLCNRSSRRSNHNARLLCHGRAFRGLGCSVGSSAQAIRP